MYFCSRILTHHSMDSSQLSAMKRTIVGIQFLFVAFGATVLVPLLIGIDPATALFTAGIGTFLFHFITKGKVPIFLGSSFAFIAPIMAASKQWGAARHVSRAHSGIVGVLVHKCSGEMARQETT